MTNVSFANLVVDFDIRSFDVTFASLLFQSSAISFYTYLNAAGDEIDIEGAPGFIFTGDFLTGGTVGGI